MYEIEDKQNRELYQQQRSNAKKDWVKNFAIVFLSIMLVLTFFSNTIMNYSLPQVATQFVQQGSITPKVRGSGVAEVEDPYSVKVPNARVVSAVNGLVGTRHGGQDREQRRVRSSRSAVIAVHRDIIGRGVRKYRRGKKRGHKTTSRLFHIAEYLLCRQ